MVSLNLDETFVVLDLDRTLFRTDAFAELIVHTASNLLRDDECSELARREKENRGNLFDISAELHSMGVEFTALSEQIVIAAAAIPMLYDGVYDVLKWLDEQNIAWGVLTYGTREQQETKLAIATNELGRELPAQIIDETYKPRYIDTWRVSDALFVPPVAINPNTQTYTSVVLVDDKRSNMPTVEHNQFGVRIDNTNGSTCIAKLPEFLIHLS